MGKSVYSLVLNDNVVDEIDKVAYTVGSSRSNLINQILAEYVSYITPEKKMQSIFETMNQIMGTQDIFKMQSHASDSMFSILSALKYKYNPTIRYCVELSTAADAIGILRIVFRTQSESLILALSDFFEIFSGLENEYLKEYFDDGVVWDFTSGKFSRTLKFEKNASAITAEQLGHAIAYYIGVLDAAIKDYFSHLDKPTLALAAISKRVKQYKKNTLIKL